MAHGTPTSHRPTPRPFEATVTLGGNEFTFQLYSRPLALGPDRNIQYYWMDSSRFRITLQQRRRDTSNFRNCVGHWWRAMQVHGLGRDQDQLRHLLLATSFGLISGTKSLQHVYRDAHLARQLTRPEELSLPESICARIQDVVRSRDRDQVRQELEEVLDLMNPPDEEVEVMRQTCEGILRHGVGLVQQDEENGLEQFLGMFDAWCQKHRKKGNQGWLRRFLDLFAYECKISFYRCYANVWIDLIPWLREHRDLDAISERFLRFWHMQNQPSVLPGGLVVPDVFCGQVLSLHPLSGFLMKDPALCEVAGRFFVSDGYEQGLAEGSTEYWDLVGAILTAAHLYRQAGENQANERCLHLRKGDAVEAISLPAEEMSEGQVLEDFAVNQKATCSKGHHPLHFVRFYGAGKSDRVRVDYRCPVCKRRVKKTFPAKTLRKWLTRGRKKSDKSDSSSGPKRQ